jgi:hypothetical protein
MINNPLDRTRIGQSQAIERGDQCYSIVVHADVSVVLPYSYLQGAVLEGSKVLLLHSMGTAEITGPEALLTEILELLSQQRLSAIRNGLDSLAVRISITSQAPLDELT